MWLLPAEKRAYLFNHTSLIVFSQIVVERQAHQLLAEALCDRTVFFCISKMLSHRRQM